MTIANASQTDRTSDGLGIIVRTIANHRRYSVSVSGRVLRTFGQVLIIRCSYVMAGSAVG